VVAAPNTWTSLNDEAECGISSFCRNGVCEPGCLFDGGVKIPAGKRNAANSCEECNGDNPSNWSPRASGSPCDEAVCQSNTCNAGRCEKRNLTQGVDCDGGTCREGTCLPSCRIEGKLVPEGQLNSANRCLECAFGKNASSWSPVAAGRPCDDDGNSCTNDVCGNGGTCTHPRISSAICDGGCLIGGTGFNAGDINPANACESCRPSASPTAWTVSAVDAGCTDDMNACTVDVCRPNMGRVVCQNLPLPEASFCAANRTAICVNNMCRNGCLIEGVFRAQGSPNPANECQVCDVTQSATSWTNEVQGVPCASDNNDCTQDICSSGMCTHPVAPAGSPCGFPLGMCNGNVLTRFVCSGASCVQQSMNCPTVTDSECQIGGGCLGSSCRSVTNFDGVPCGSFMSGRFCCNGRCACGP
jgi:hypothetical protein